MDFIEKNLIKKPAEFLAEDCWSWRSFVWDLQELFEKQRAQYFTWWLSDIQITWSSLLWTKLFNLISWTLRAETSVNFIILDDIWPLSNRNYAQSWYLVLQFREKWKKLICFFEWFFFGQVKEITNIKYFCSKGCLYSEFYFPSCANFLWISSFIHLSKFYLEL